MQAWQVFIEDSKVVKLFTVTTDSELSAPQIKPSGWVMNCSIFNGSEIGSPLQIASRTGSCIL